jgi:dienelactone hydrolase
MVISNSSSHPSPTGHAINVSVLSLRAKVLKPTDWLKLIFTNPLDLIRALRVMIPFSIHTRSGVAKPRVLSFFQALRSSPPPFPTDALKIGVAGFCWGGRYTVLLAADKPSSRVPAYNPATSTADGPLTSLIDCAFTAHPAMLKVPADIEAVTRPLSVTDGNEDQWMGRRTVAKMSDVLKKKGDDYECEILTGARHGFALRWDPKDEKQSDYAATAETQAINWFTRWLS